MPGNRPACRSIYLAGETAGKWDHCGCCYGDDVGTWSDLRDVDGSPYQLFRSPYWLNWFVCESPVMGEPRLGARKAETARRTEVFMLTNDREIFYVLLK